LFCKRQADLLRKLRAKMVNARAIVAATIVAATVAATVAAMVAASVVLIDCRGPACIISYSLRVPTACAGC